MYDQGIGPEVADDDLYAVTTWSPPCFSASFLFIVIPHRSSGQGILRGRKGEGKKGGLTFGE
jgi:hypothetical protein